MRSIFLAVSLALLPVGTALAKDKVPAATGAKVRGYDPSELAGKWVEDGGHFTQIKVKKGMISVKKIVDSDGEVFVVLSQGVRDGHFMFRYLVPSTSYEVTYEITSISGDTASYDWTNDHDASGSDQMTR